MLELELKDNEWEYDYIDHDRQIVRAVVVDGSGYFYFVRAIRDDLFGKATLIETSGGGVEPSENLEHALRRELAEELGVRVSVLCKLGTVSDYYNLIHRHNINHYYLCKAESFGEKRLTQSEIECFHLSTLRLTFEESIAEYEACSNSSLGRLVANRELPVVRRAKEILQTL